MQAALLCVVLKRSYRYSCVRSAPPCWSFSSHVQTLVANTGVCTDAGGHLEYLGILHNTMTVIESPVRKELLSHRFCSNSKQRLVPFGHVWVGPPIPLEVERIPSTRWSGREHLLVSVVRGTVSDKLYSIQPISHSVS